MVSTNKYVDTVHFVLCGRLSMFAQVKRQEMGRFLPDHNFPTCQSVFWRLGNVDTVTTWQGRNSPICRSHTWVFSVGDNTIFYFQCFNFQCSYMYLFCFVLLVCEKIRWWSREYLSMSVRWTLLQTMVHLVFIRLQSVNLINTLLAELWSRLVFYWLLIHLKLE